MREICTLDDIVSDYPIMLIDTSVLLKSLTDKITLVQLNGKNIVLEKDHQFRVELMKYLKGDMPIFITSLVSEEYLSGKHYSYKNAIKKLDSRGVKNRREQMETNRKIDAAQKEEKKLINTFEENERILKLNEKERSLYRNFYERYPDVQNMYELSETDFDLLISGAVLAQTRNFCALLSNDFGIVKGWGYFLKKEKLNIKQFGFFVREDGFKFERLK